MLRSPVVWGAGLSIVLGCLSSVVLPPAFIGTIPSVLNYTLPDNSASKQLDSFVELSITTRIILALMVLTILQMIKGVYQRTYDRGQFGLDVMEVPQVKLRWPFNADLIPFDINIMRTGKYDVPRMVSKMNLSYFHRILRGHLGGFGCVVWKYFQFKALRTGSCRHTKIMIAPY
jgi:hypothetical protein